MINLIKLFETIFSLGAASARAAGLEDLNPTPWSTTNPTAVNSLLDSILNRIPVFLGGLALLALIYSSLMYILALGDPAKMEAAKKNITWAVVGILLASSVYLIIYLASWITRPGFPT